MDVQLTANIRVIRKYEFTGAEFRRLRVVAGLSERQLAAVLGKSRRQIQRMQSWLRIEMSHAEVTALLKIVGATLL